MHCKVMRTLVSCATFLLMRSCKNTDAVSWPGSANVAVMLSCCCRPALTCKSVMPALAILTDIPATRWQNRPVQQTGYVYNMWLPTSGSHSGCTFNADCHVTCVLKPNEQANMSCGQKARSQELAYHILWIRPSRHLHVALNVYSHA